MHTHSEPVRLASSPDDYARFKVAKGHIEQWEDGMGLLHRSLNGGKTWEPLAMPWERQLSS